MGAVRGLASKSLHVIEEIEEVAIKVEHDIKEKSIQVIHEIEEEAKEIVEVLDEEFLMTRDHTGTRGTSDKNIEGEVPLFCVRWTDCGPHSEQQWHVTILGFQQRFWGGLSTCSAPSFG